MDWDAAINASRVAAAVAMVALSLIAALHALLNKRRAPAALGWIAVCLMLPGVGALLYFLFGINRVKTRAQRLWENAQALERPPEADHNLTGALQGISLLGHAVTGEPLTPANSVRPLIDGDEAYPRMIEGIVGAARSVYLASYIFESNHSGRAFIDALTTAHERGVTVRVLIDGVGSLYSWPRAHRLLAKAGVPVARFLPTRLFPPALHVNLRNHRKLLVIDGVLAYTGGMNIGDRHVAARTDECAHDVQFEINGPVCAMLQRVFLEDWHFATGEALTPDHPNYDANGDARCRIVVDGPNEDFDKFRMILHAAIQNARRRVMLMTPYFLPPEDILVALQTAALKGIEVEIIIPKRSNIPPVTWASRHQLGLLLNRGVEIHELGPPFNHAKLLVIDEEYSLIGTANIDPRSLRLNFELGVEVYSRTLARWLTDYFDEHKSRARRMPLHEYYGRSFFVRVRDAAAWLGSSYI